MTNSAEATFREKLWPSPWLMITLLLLVPATTLTMMPINPSLALPVAIGVYVIIAGSLALMSPVIEVRNGTLSAGAAKIPAALTGDITELSDAELRKLIGPGADARAFLLVRGFIHRGVRIEITDAADPTPYWVLTTRKPQSLRAAIAAAKG